MPGKAIRAQRKDLTTLVSNTFHLPGTGRLILETLMASKTAFSVKDLLKRVKRSERSVRGALDHLVAKGVLIRKVSITGRKRLAYLYTVGPMDRMVKVVRGEILNQLENLERLEGTLHELKVPG
jgi:predicted transcriptional regulator